MRWGCSEPSSSHCTKSDPTAPITSPATCAPTACYICILQRCSYVLLDRGFPVVLKCAHSPASCWFQLHSSLMGRTLLPTQPAAMSKKGRAALWGAELLQNAYVFLWSQGNPHSEEHQDRLMQMRTCLTA